MLNYKLFDIRIIITKYSNYGIINTIMGVK